MARRRSTSHLRGLIVVDKPAGLTSHDVVARVRKASGQRRTGHTGTLDPFATGVLVVCLGQATRLAARVTDGDKRYRATMRLGQATTTQDLTGETTDQVAEATVAAALADGGARLRELARGFVGPIGQLPPMFSAKRKDGVRLHELARQGEVVDREPVTVIVHALELLSIDGADVELDVRCGKGTYIRTLAHDLGAALGTHAHLTALRRTEVGDFTLAEATPLDALDCQSAVETALLPPLRAVSELPTLELAAEQLARLRHGRQIELAGLPPTGTELAITAKGELAALAVVQDGRLQPRLVLADE